MYKFYPKREKDTFAVYAEQIEYLERKLGEMPNQTKGQSNNPELA